MKNFENIIRGSKYFLFELLLYIFLTLKLMNKQDLLVENLEKNRIV